MASSSERGVTLSPATIRLVDDVRASGAFADDAAAIHAALDAWCNRPAGDIVGGGECGERIRAFAWAQTPLGPIAGWSPELRTTVANMLNSPVAAVLLWGETHIMIYNDLYRTIAGDRHPSALGSPVATAFPDVWDWNRPILAAGLRGETVSHRDQPIVFDRPGGTETLYLDLFYTPVRCADGSVGGVLCTIVDNSARIAAEREAADRAAELRRVTDATPMLVSYIDRDHVYRFANAAYERWFGTSVSQTIGSPMRAILGDALYESRRVAIDRALAGEAFASEVMVPIAGGGERRFEFRYVPHIESDGSIPGVHVIGIDVEDRAEREAALDRSNRRFRTAMDAVHGVLWTNSADGRMVGEQPGWGALTGQTEAEYADYGWAAAVHPDDAQPTIDAWHRALATKSMFVFEHRVRRHCGEWRTFALRALPIIDGEGEILEWVGVHTDITHRRAAETALRDHAAMLEREVRHRQRAESQLRQLNETLETRVIAEIDERRQAEAKLAQAQKMETVGKLTGGVAHDFNNLLQVVSGNLQLLAKDIAGNDRAERRVANAMAGVSRGSKLAAQLLAFGRRQALEPKVVNVTRFVRGMDDMLRRAIGEGIEIETVVGGGLWNTFIDPVQIENALLNLAINARDAMDGHGRLTIELGNAHLDDDYARSHDDVEAGQYVMLAVTDTGTGMSRDVIDKVFEPFFSTKSEGKGSGLGLSMVYGFVKQSGGHVKIYSEVGEGTTIRLYLPRALDREDVEVLTDSGPITGGHETVLVVEDDAEVRATVVEMLTDLGYRVLKAVDAQSALSVVESGVPIDILFTDVVMPGTLKSPELARKARERLPDIAVLFTSGYTENSIVHGGKLDAGLELLSKPYTREALARKFRQVLASNRLQRDRVAERDAVHERTAATVLLVEDDALIRASTAEALRDSGCVVIEAESAEDAVAVLRTAAIDVLVTDLNLPGASGSTLAAHARESRPGIGLVFATGDVDAVERGAVEGAVYLPKPYGVVALQKAVETATRRPVAMLP